MLHNVIIVLCFRNTWFHITTAFITFTFQHTAFHNKLATFCFAFFNGIQIHFHCIFINQWPYMIFFIQRIADL